MTLRKFFRFASSIQSLSKDLPCTEFVQTAVSLVLTRVFDSQASFFHMVFNRNVENCYGAFTIPPLLERSLVPELLAARKRAADRRMVFVLVVIHFFLVPDVDRDEASHSKCR